MSFRHLMVSRLLGLKLLFCAFCLAGITARADVSVAVDHNSNGQTSAEFKFKTVPSPARSNAAIAAKFSIVAGDKDDNSADLSALHDGKLPGQEDQPDENFFFKDGSDGGRIVIDIGSAIDIRQINTYSWHPSSRAAQVYVLYGSDGSAAGFKAAPPGDLDPGKCGWTLIAKVDTRPRTDDPGGQYGVSISNGDKPVGKYRYLLLACSRTESDDDFGNTFFSEVTVIDAAEMMGEPVSPAKPGVRLLQIDKRKYTATIDTSETPDLTEWAEKDLSPVVVEWYPRLVEMLPSDGYSPPKHFSITFRQTKPGVADTTGTRINCAAAWFRTELKGQAKGAIVHEMVHVVQQYGDARRTNPHPLPNPGWLVEGIPDYIRWYKYEPASNGAAITTRGFARASYDGSYRVSANFLNWAVEKYDKSLIEELDTAMRQGKYTPEIWSKLTGRKIDELGALWKAELGKSLGIEAAPVAN